MSSSRMTSRRTFFKVGAAGTALVVAGRAGFSVSMAQAPTLEKKDNYKVGFAQTESNNPWRLAQTASMKDEAEDSAADQLVYTDAADAAKQVADVNSMIAQRRRPHLPAAARRKSRCSGGAWTPRRPASRCILVDRNVDHTLAKPGDDYRHLHRLGLRRGGPARRRMAGQGDRRQGARSSSSRAPPARRPPTTARRASTTTHQGRRRPGMEIVASQSGDFARDKGRQVAETLLQAHPDATAVYAHNDEMALGAIAAIEAAGKKPGKDIIVVSIDGEKDGVRGDRRRQARRDRASATRASGRSPSTS